MASDRRPEHKNGRILIWLRIDCMTMISFLDDFFAFLDENRSFSSNYVQIGLKLMSGCEKIPACFLLLLREMPHKGNPKASDIFKISIWVSPLELMNVLA